MKFFQRLIYSVLLIFSVITMNFFLLKLSPGDPAEAIAGTMGGITPEILEEIRSTYGLDQHWSKQLFIYLKRMLTFDLGKSYFYNQSVISLIVNRLVPTILLVVSAILCSVLVGVSIGITAAKKPNGKISHFVSLFSLAGYSLPIFWSGLMFIILFASIIPIFPAQGFQDITRLGQNLLFQIPSILHHLILPCLTLSIVYLAQYSRMSRASMLEVLASEYIRTARSKGLSEKRILYVHALKNAILPIVTIVGLQFGNMLSGAILVESVFSWPGLGRLAFEAILSRDYPVVLGILFFSSLMVIVANLITDYGYRRLDPRIR